jgi:hypothetical protein
MVKKKKTASGKRTVVRVDPNAAQKSPPKPAVEVKGREPESDILEIRRSAREKNEGFGVIKTVVGVIIVLIIGSMILFNRSGAGNKARGDKLPGESCTETVECSAGSVCYSYKGTNKRCLTLCDKGKKCAPGTKCVSATEQKRRKGFRVTDVCVKDALL